MGVILYASDPSGLLYRIDAAGGMFRISPSGNEVAFSGWGSGVLELERSIFQAEHLGPSRSATEVPDMVAGRITDCRSDAGAA